jgi:hypothetical protein
MDWKKPQTIIATITGAITIFGTVFFVYNWITPRHEHEALADEVHTEYVKQEELLAVNKNVQQTNYQFWIAELKRQISELYKELRQETDPIKQEQIRNEIDSKKRDLQHYQDKLNELK